MNHLLIKTSIIFVFLFFSLKLAAIQEIEPNDTYPAANIVSINSAISGTVGYNDDTEDWYKVTLPSDGKIQIVETMTSELFSGIYLYDDNGTDRFDQKVGQHGGSDTLTYTNLAAGIIYFKIINWSTSHGSYTLQINFYPATLNNDVEPNNIFSQAKDLGVNTETTGHVGFHFHPDTIDTEDWYKVTLPSDGKIQIVETMTSELFSGIYLYDDNGTDRFDQKVGQHGGSDTLTYTNLAAGIIYFKIINWSTSHGSYTLQINFYPATLNNDVEPNNIFSQAKDLGVNTETTGHVGFHFHPDTIDTEDWYKVTLPSDSKIQVIETTSSTLFSGIYLYDSNGGNEFYYRAGRKGVSDTLTYNNLAAGVFYVKIINWGNCYGSYNLKVNAIPATLNNDVEPNGEFSQAKDLAVNTETTGHVGYFSNNVTDNDDWYKITLPSEGKIQVIETTSSEQYSGIYLYDATGTNQFDSKSGLKGGSDTLNHNNILAAGIYYIKIINWGNCYGSYSLKAIFSQTSSISDPDVDAYSISINSNSGRITIKSKNINSLEIYNLLGENVYSTATKSQQGIYDIDISSCPKGIYLIKIYDGKKVYSEKILIL